MTKKEVNKYIKKGDIPLSFMFNNQTYYFFIDVNGHTTSTAKGVSFWYKYPTWSHKIGDTNSINFCDINTTFYSSKNTFEECLSEFLFWWEVNKHRFTNIEYYKP